MTDYEFGQKVMAAAGVEPRKKVCMCDGQECRSDCRGGEPEYSNPLTAKGHDALWDALVAKRWYVSVVAVVGDGYVARVLSQKFSGDVHHADRKAALVEAAAKALGLSR